MSSFRKGKKAHKEGKRFLSWLGGEERIKQKQKIQNPARQREPQSCRIHNQLLLPEQNKQLAEISGICNIDRRGHH